jgi:hypothetical protein
MAAARTEGGKAGWANRQTIQYIAFQPSGTRRLINQLQVGAAPTGGKTNWFRKRELIPNDLRIISQR